MTQTSPRMMSTALSWRPILLILPFALALVACSAPQTAAPHSTVGVQSGSSVLPPDAGRPNSPG